MRVKIYVEGGGDNEALRTECRKGFSKFIEKAGFKEKMPRVVACGSRKDAYDSFLTAIETAKGDEFALLLVDSEAPVELSVWQHLTKRDGWQQPNGASSEQGHLMVQCMESWFLADRTSLEQFFGQGFKSGSLPKNPQIEDIPKNDVAISLKQASRDTKTKGEYHKGKHSFDILGRLDPEKVQKASKHARAFFDTLRSKVGA